MKKWKIAALCTVLACLSIVASGTLAYFTASETAHNVITSGGVDIRLHEFSERGNEELVPWQDVDGVMPGAEISKIVTVENTGASDAWVRVKVDKTIILADGDKGKPEVMKLDIKDAFWTEQDGYYYYNDPLAPGETTPPLFTIVTFDPKMGNEYQGSTAHIDVKADAVQVANNPVEGNNVLDAQGWPKEDAT